MFEQTVLILVRKLLFTLRFYAVVLGKPGKLHYIHKTVTNFANQHTQARLICTFSHILKQGVCK